MDEEPRLTKGLGFIEVFCIATGAMISSGLFILPGIAHAVAGPAVVISYFLAGLLALTGALSLAELATAMPRAGGDYFFVSRGMGPAVGTVSGLLSWFALSLKSAFALVGMAAFAFLVVGIDARLVGAVLCVVFVAINLKGVKHAGRLQVWLVAGLLVLTLLYIVRGLPAVEVAKLSPFASKGTAAVFTATGLVFVSYGGLLKIASVSEEVRNPSRVIPAALVASLVVVVILYTLMVFVTSGVLADDVLDASRTPISDGAAVFLGSPGRIALAVGAILAFVSTANAGIMAASRYLLALSRDALLPPFLSRVSEKRRTPDAAILATGAAMLTALFLKLEILIAAASTVVILTYMLANLSVVVMRESHVQNYRPSFRSPLYPWVQLLGIIGFSFVILEMGVAAFLISALLVCVGLLAYWRYGRKTADREYALLHLIERVTARELVTGTLETELKEIIRERDEVIQDRFDRTIERSIVMDLKGPMKVEEFFAEAAKRIDEATPFKASDIEEFLIQREKDSSTVIAPGIAIPHIVVEGHHYFDILLARCRDGVFFKDDAPNVHAIFVLFGTSDERNFHLRALAAIAQVLQEKSFEKHWMAARTTQALRDVVLMAKRLRGK